MGVQSTMTIGSKSTASAIGVLTGEGSYPSQNQVSIISIQAGGDEGRLADIHRAVGIVIDYVRDNNSFVGAGSMAYVTTLDGGKNSVIEKFIASDIITGHVGIMVVGSVHNKGNRLDTENAHRQLLDWMRENKRLSS